MFGLVESAAYEGRYEKNPYNFKDFSMTFACLYCNGIQIPSKPFTPDFPNNCYSREYMSLFRGTGRHFTDNGLDISLQEYKSGNCLIAVGPDG